MKTKLNNKSGITLIALVVTILILLILSGITINMLFGENGILARAKNADNTMKNAQQKDLDELDRLSNWIDEKTNTSNGGSTGGDDTPNPPTATWTQTKTTVTNGKDVYTVGQAYTYDSGNSGYDDTDGWKVLGAKDGKLLIMTTKDIGTLGLKGTSGDGTTDYPAGYLNGIDKLNTMCQEKFGSNARSINVEDINRVTGYDPTKQNNNTKYGAGEFWEYGNKVTYTASGSSATNGKTYTGSISYEHPDGRKIGTNNVTSITVESTFYYYYPNTLTTSSSGDTNGIATDSPAYTMLFLDTSGNKCSYWLASSYVDADSNYSDFGVRIVDSDGSVGGCSLWGSDGGAGSDGYGVRVVVSL